jgi:SWI/SNF-related matrix-associated actin-dependent regulator 1 of chromatin subfamily A
MMWSGLEINMSKLMPYQNQGAEFLAARKTAFLADEPGLGKCAQTIRACDMLGAETILIICPASVCKTWEREFEKFSQYVRYIHILRTGMKPYGGAVNIVSYDLAATVLKEALMLLKYEVLVLDEGHYLKNPQTKRTQAVYGWKGQKGFVHISNNIYVLSGTPAPNNPLELYPHCKALFADAFQKKNGGYMNKTDFLLRYCKTEKNGFGLKIVGGKNLSELKERLTPYLLRRKKTEVQKDLPPVIETELYLEPKASDRRTTSELELQMQLVEQALKSKNPIKAIEELAPHVATLRRYLGMLKVAPLIEWVKDQLDGGLEKIVIYAYHKDVIEGLRFFLSKVFHVVSIDGSTISNKRDEQAQKFQNDPNCRVFIGQIQAAGTGLNELVVAHTMVLAEFSWVPAENEQVIGRLYRIGQTKNPLIYYAMIADSLDEHIARVARGKAKMLSELFD